MPGSVIVAATRTPIGKLSGAFASLTAVDLGAIAIRDALAHAGLDGANVDYVVMGQVLQAGTGQITARQAAVAAGIPMLVPAITINKVCLSGLNALYLADQMIQSGEANVVVAGGMESMTRAPYLVPGARSGLRMGNADMVDSMIHDGLWCAFDAAHMGSGTERYTTDFGIARDRQDTFATQSHERASAALKSGALAEEITPVVVPQRKGDPITIDTDEGIRPGTTTDVLAELRPAFAPDGTITAGNASQISDGAAALIVMHADRAAELGIEPLAEIVSYGMVAGPDTSLLHQPSRAIRNALERSNYTVADLDLFEINEAFAAVALASIDDLGIDHTRVNVNGGAIALGHPIGMSGARLAGTLLHELRRRGGGMGAAALCGGGGQGDALILRVR
ncbi:MAG: acetyl-CoA C-acetyltransferase [Acidimicrobiia bacterium]